MIDTLGSQIEIRIPPQAGTDLIDIPVCLDIEIPDVTAALGEAVRKMAILAAGGEEVPVEVAAWDVLAGTARLWVRVPTLAAAGDTPLILCYDPASADNTAYVGTTAEPAEHPVWETAIGLWPWIALSHWADPQPTLGPVVEDRSTAIADLMLARMSSAFTRQRGTTLHRLLQPIAAEASRVRATLAEVQTAHQVAHAADDSLDRIAAGYLLLRDGRSDDALRGSVYDEINRRRRSGTLQDLISALGWRSALVYGTDYQLREAPFPITGLEPGRIALEFIPYDVIPADLPGLVEALLITKPAGVVPILRISRTQHRAQVATPTTTVHTEMLVSVLPGITASLPTATLGTRHTQEDLTTWNQDFSDLAGWTTVSAGTPASPSVSATGALNLALANTWGGPFSTYGVQQQIDMTDIGEVLLDVHVSSSWCLKDGYFLLKIGDTTVLQVADANICNPDSGDFPAPWHRNLYVDVRAYTGLQTVAFLAGVEGAVTSTTWRAYCIVDNVRFIRPAP